MFIIVFRGNIYVIRIIRVVKLWEEKLIIFFFFVS